MKEKMLTRNKKYECSFLTLFEDHVLLPNESEGQRVVIKHVGGASVLPITKDHHIILTKQYRYPIQEISIEIPAGKKDFVEEDGLTCAKRELEEETGYQSEDFEHLFTFYPCVGYSDEKLDIYMAHNCYKVEHPKPMDDDEMIDLLIVTPQEAEDMIRKGIIKDGKTMIAIQSYLMKVAYEKKTY